MVINNLKAYANNCKFIVAKKVEDTLWFEGADNDLAWAVETAVDLHGVIFGNISDIHVNNLGGSVHKLYRIVRKVNNELWYYDDTDDIEYALDTAQKIGNGLVLSFTDCNI